MIGGPSPDSLKMRFLLVDLDLMQFTDPSVSNGMSDIPFSVSNNPPIPVLDMGYFTTAGDMLPAFSTSIDM